MFKVVCPDEMKKIDEYMINKKKISALMLMENAAFGISSLIMDKFDKNCPVFAVCGTGNNGGDGFAAARQLESNGYAVKPVLIGKKENLKGGALINAEYFINENRLLEVFDEEKAKKILAGINKGDIVIDAIFGTGLARNVEGIYKTSVNIINKSGAYVVSADIPSGIDAKTGQVLGEAVYADETVTFQYAKPGHFIYPGRQHAGKLHVRKIGSDQGFDTGYDWRAYPSDTKDISLPKRKRNTHKGDYGYLAILAGGRGYAGAGYMCITASLKSGAGVVTAGIPESMADVYQKKLNEAVTYPIKDREGRFYDGSIKELPAFLAGKNALAAGPGLAQGEGMLEFVRHVVCDYDIKKVFDADALNIMAKDINMLKKSRGELVLTPHLKEFSRLKGMPVADILKNPAVCALAFAKEYNVTLLLKGATTIIASVDGSVSFMLAGSPGMAKGGSGDVLTGVIGSLLAQGFNAHKAAVTGAHICGLAGGMAAMENGEYSMTAMDTIKHIKDAVKLITA